MHAVVYAATVIQLARSSSTKAAARSEEVNSNADTASFLTVLYKLQSAASTANSIMGLHDPFSGRPLDAIRALRALIHTFPSIDNAAHLMSKRDISSSSEKSYLSFSSSHKKINEEDKLDELEELTSSFEFAEAAYEERNVLTSRLKTQGYFLVFHEIHTKPGEVSYYMAFNPMKKIVLIGIKGTDAVTDVFTNLICLPMEKELGVHDDGVMMNMIKGKNKKVAYLHEGMTLAATHINRQIFETLKYLFLPQGYEIVITGHSLGAGTASILGLLLKEELCNLHTENVKSLNMKHTVMNYDWSNRVKVLAYATPPVMDYKTAESTKSYITSVVLKSDIIPRASINNLITIMNVLFEIDTILQKGETTTTISESGEKVVEKREAWNLKLSSKEAYDILQRSIEKAPHEKTSSMMFVPGKVLRVYNASDGNEDNNNKKQPQDDSFDKNDNDSNTASPPSGVGRKTSGGKLKEDNSYLSAVETDGRDYVLRMIHPSTSMLNDHSSMSYKQALVQLVRQHLDEMDDKARQLHIDANGDFFTR
jgi:hypothetical protein